MCGPALAIVGGIVQGIGAYSSGMAQANSLKATAAGLHLQAQGERNAGAYESERQGEKIARLTGQQVTGVAANGFDLTGSMGDVINDSRTQGELDKAMIRANWQHKSNMSDFQADVASKNAKAAKTGAIIGAIAPVMSGFQSAFQMVGA